MPTTACERALKPSTAHVFPWGHSCTYQYFRSSQGFKEGSLVPLSPTQNQVAAPLLQPVGCVWRAAQPGSLRHRASWEARPGWAGHSRLQRKPEGPSGQTALGSSTRCQQQLSLNDICSCLPSRVWLGRVQLRSWPEPSLKEKVSLREHILLSAG